MKTKAAVLPVILVLLTVSTRAEEDGSAAPPKIGQSAHGVSGWQRDPTSLLTNFNNMYNPCVVETGGEWRYRMWFFGWSARHANLDMGWGCDAIFHARSRDLKTWEVWSGNEQWDATMNPELWRPVLHASERWYDAWHNGDPSVVLEDGRFYMAYSATSKPFAKTVGFPAEMVQCVMGATSADGIRWEKTAAPLLIREEDTAEPKPTPSELVISTGRASGGRGTCGNCGSTIGYPGKEPLWALPKTGVSFPSQRAS